MTALKMNETNRELLTWAAKAAGLPHKWIPMLGKMLHIIDAGNSDTWDPLTDDGDALILAVGLRLEIEFGSHFVNVGRSDINKEWHLAREEFGNNPLAATRLAIVRAAAEIGRGIVQQATCVDLPEDNYYKSITDSQ